jgi:hypothetical protein
MVVDEFYCTPTTTSLAIALFANKSFFLVTCSRRMDNVLWSSSKGEKLNQMLLKFVLLCSFGICNLIVSLKHCFDNLSSIDYILKLKALSKYNYIEDNCFLDQQVGQKVYLFKMSIDGAVFKFDLCVKCNQMMIFKMRG